MQLSWNKKANPFQVLCSFPLFRKHFSALHFGFIATGHFLPSSLHDTIVICFAFFSQSHTIQSCVQFWMESSLAHSTRIKTKCGFVMENPFFCTQELHSRAQTTLRIEVDFWAWGKFRENGFLTFRQHQCTHHSFNFTLHHLNIIQTQKKKLNPTVLCRLYQGEGVNPM